VVAVVGHWLPETTSIATKYYTEADLAFVAAGSEPFDPFDPDGLPVDFQRAYEAVTPFDEVAGPMAGPAYDAFGLVIEAMRLAASSEGTISRESMNESLYGLSYKGLTGQVNAVNIIE
jgi:ABC-type branched-subunit amino acid transport system substrate-binding protein